MLEQTKTFNFQDMPLEIIEKIILYCMRPRENLLKGKHRGPLYPKFRDCITLLSMNKFFYDQTFCFPNNMELFQKVEIDHKNLSILRHLRFKKIFFYYNDEKIDYDLFTKIFSEYPTDFSDEIHLEIHKVPEREVLSVFNKINFKNFFIDINNPVQDLKMKVDINAKKLKLTNQFRNVLLEFDKQRTFKNVILNHVINGKENEFITLKDANIGKLQLQHFRLTDNNIQFLNSNIRSIEFKDFILNYRGDDNRFLIDIPDKTENISFVDPTHSDICFIRNFTYNMVCFDFRLLDYATLIFEDVVSVQNMVIRPPTYLHIAFNSHKSAHINTMTLRKPLEPFYYEHFILSFENFHENNRIEKLEITAIKQHLRILSTKKELFINELNVYFTCRNNPERKLEIYFDGVRIENLKVFIYSKSIKLTCARWLEQNSNSLDDKIVKKATVFFKDPEKSRTDEKYHTLFGKKGPDKVEYGKQNHIIFKGLKSELKVESEYGMPVDIQSN